MTGTDTPPIPFLPNWRAPSPEGLEEILERHLPWVQSHVRRRLGDFRRSKVDTGDIVQDAMVQFLRFGPRIRLANDRQFRNLLGRIVENVICDNYDWFSAQRRALARERPLPPDTVLILDPPVNSVESPSQIVSNHEEAAWIRLGLELLEPTLRQVIVLRRWEDLSFAEIADRMGTSKSTARRKYLQSVNRLIELVDALKTGRIDDALGDSSVAALGDTSVAPRDGAPPEIDR